MDIQKINKAISKFNFEATPQLNGVINIKSIGSTITYENIFEYIKALFPLIREDYVTFG